MSGLSVGVLALQGAFVEHEEALERVGATPRQVRTVARMDGLDALVIPGGESTTIGLIGGDSGLVDAIRSAVAGGLPVFGTGAGMIMLASSTTGGRQPLIGGMDIVVRRNAFGRQVASFEADVSMPSVGDDPFPGVFIRAPWIEEHGPSVEVLATVRDHPVAARQGSLLVTAFHPEITGDDRVHRLFVDIVRGDGTGNQATPTVGGGIRVRPQ